MNDHIADLFALQHWRARAAELERERDEAKQRWGRTIDELGRVIKILAGTDDDVAAVNACQPYASDLARRVVAERDEARALLRELEWGEEYRTSESTDWEQDCPACGQRRRDGHAQNCRLDAALGGRDE